MNVIVSNEQKQQLEDLDCEVIKKISGSFSALEINEMFQDFFYNKIILDVTALKDYKNISTYEEIRKVLDPSKIILLLPPKSELCKASFLSQLITVGFYNFTPDIKGIKYLLTKTNTLDDVKKIYNVSEKVQKSELNDEYNNNQMTVRDKDPIKIIGFKNVTEHAGATTLIYMLKKELNLIYGNETVACLEIGSDDFKNFNERNMFSVFEDSINKKIEALSDKRILLVDMNKFKDEKICETVYYLIEPSMIKLSKMMDKNKFALEELKEKKVILNKSMLNNSDIPDFEKESSLKIFYNIPSLNERKKNQLINDFLIKIGLLGSSNDGNNGKIFGLFRR